ncbi:MAG: RNA 2',3'-cyclic phosphodiesterase [Candidatus Bilamarchaeaceae archaeon]
MEMKRLFVAVEIPQLTRKKISQFSSQLKDKDIRLVDEKNLHITLRFIGEVPEQNVEEIKEKLNKIKENKFECKIEGVGVFPTENYIRVIWVGIISDGLKKVAKKIDEVLAGIGKKEDREFSAHLTIGRVNKKTDLKKFLEENKNINFGSFEVDKFVLFESKLTPNGPIYTKLAEFELI